MGFARETIYTIKRALHKTPQVYEPLYNLLTANRDLIRLPFERDHYPSRFGGLWTDRDDFDALLAKKDVAARYREPLRRWREDGFIIHRKAISEPMIDAFVARLDALPQNGATNLLVTNAEAHEGVAYRPELLNARTGARIVDAYYAYSEARDILFSAPILDFIKIAFGSDPLLTQSLNFEYGSGQPLHQDTSFVIMTAPLKMAAVWVALEDVKPGAGALTYLPGSHRWGDFLFSGRFKHWDSERDGEKELDAWTDWMENEAARRGVEPASFDAKKGDIFIWHAGLIHGGGEITDEQATRRSLVAHYCPAHIRPLYHLYKPGQRRIYNDKGRKFSSAFYR